MLPSEFLGVKLFFGVRYEPSYLFWRPHFVPPPECIGQNLLYQMKRGDEHSFTNDFDMYSRIPRFDSQPCSHSYVQSTLKLVPIVYSLNGYIANCICQGYIQLLTPPP